MKKKTVMASLGGILFALAVILFFPSSSRIIRGEAEFKLDILVIAGVVLIIVSLYFFVYRPNIKK